MGNSPRPSTRTSTSCLQGLRNAIRRAEDELCNHLGELLGYRRELVVHLVVHALCISIPCSCHPPGCSASRFSIDIIYLLNAVHSP